MTVALGTQPSQTTADWYRDVVVYQLHVRAFADSNGDGVGDFRGLTARLPYLRDLGVTALWLLPFYPSPLRDDGYDIADYRGVHPAYGTLRDVRAFLREAHRLGIRVVTELVLNHTSDQHPWFQRARRAAPGSRWRDWYVWSDHPDRYADARIIFQDFETSNWSWDPVAGAYYWHRFYSHQPDLNFENAEVQAEMLRVLDFWFGLGVDGLRLDAVPYLFEAEGTTCENLPATHDYLRRLRAHIDARHPGRLLLAEANQWPEDAAEYFGRGDECHMAFHFPLMPRLFMALNMEDRFPVVDILQQTPAAPDGCQWALFLRNHDELTLEMVTDEERDYMYRVYASDPAARINLGIRRRLAPLLENDRSKIELMNGLLLSLPGTPVLYYGDEIGMGDNVYLGDRDGVRTPMQWNPDRNAGFSTANPQRLYLPTIIDPANHYEQVNVEAQLGRSSSLLWWMRRILALRAQHPVFGRGDLEFLLPDNPHVLAYLRQTPEDVVLVVANLSRHAQFVEVDLSRFRGARPVELFGGTPFPTIGDLPYLLTLSPHGFYWMSIVSRPEEPSTEPPVVDMGRRAPASLFDGSRDDDIEEALLRFLPRQRWYAGKARRLRQLHVLDVLPLEGRGAPLAVVVGQAHYETGEPETYVVPVEVLDGHEAEDTLHHRPESVIARLRSQGREMLLIDAMHRGRATDELVTLVERRRRLRTRAGRELEGQPTPAFRTLAGPRASRPAATVMQADQSNASAAVGDRLVVKLYRRVHAGVNPEDEVGRHLGRHRFVHHARLAGSVSLVDRADETTLAVVHELVANEGDAWHVVLGELGRRYEEALTRPEPPPPPPPMTAAELVAGARGDQPEPTQLATLVAGFVGRRLGALHRLLADDGGDPAFAPEPFGPLYQRSLMHAARTQVQRVTQALTRVLPDLGEPAAAHAREVLERRSAILDRLLEITRRPVHSPRIRIHGDLHLAQVLWTGRDVVFIDFEGEPLRSVGERRLKRSAFRDVAGMLRSIDYAAQVALRSLVARGLDPAAGDGHLDGYALDWVQSASREFLHEYLVATDDAAFAPRDDEEATALLEAFLVEKALYEVDYELGARPEMVDIPLRGLLRIVQAG